MLDNISSHQHKNDNILQIRSNAQDVGISVPECLDHESPIELSEGVVVCADKRCILDPQYFEIEVINNFVELKGTPVPAFLKRCEKNTLRLGYVDSRGPEYRIVKEYTFKQAGVYAEVIMPSYVYTRTWVEQTSKWDVQVFRPNVIADLSDISLPRKLRVTCDRFTRLLDFCRFSIHTHSITPNVICCKRLCSRPEPLTTIELSAIRVVAQKEPYYTCSWLEKQILFKWHVGREEFEPYWLFDQAIGVYTDMYNRYDLNSFKLFAFNIWKEPDESITNADEVYFKSAINLAGYKWYEPSAIDEENEERYDEFKIRISESSIDLRSVKIAQDVMNLINLPENIILSSSLFKSYSFDMGVEIRDYPML